MASSHVPRDLTLAFSWLCRTLERAIAEYDQRENFADVEAVSERAADFVAKLSLVSGAYDELQRRADFVETATGAGTEFRRLLKAARRACSRVRPRESSHYLVEWARHEVSQAIRWDKVWSLSQVRAMARAIKKYAALAPKVPRQLETFLVVLQKLEADAPAHGDGYRSLRGCYEQREQSSKDYDDLREHAPEMYKGMGRLIGGYLKPMRAAAHAMMEWIQAASTGARQPRRKRPGRKKANRQSQEREAAVVAAWQRAKETGAYMPAWVKDRGIELKDFKKLQGRVRARNRRADK
jgi:hypothetical protein